MVHRRGFFGLLAGAVFARKLPGVAAPVSGVAIARAARNAAEHSIDDAVGITLRFARTFDREGNLSLSRCDVYYGVSRVKDGRIFAGSFEARQPTRYTVPGSRDWPTRWRLDPARLPE